jgi:hypothetical protein
MYSSLNENRLPVCHKNQFPPNAPGVHRFVLVRGGFNTDGYLVTGGQGLYEFAADGDGGKGCGSVEFCSSAFREHVLILDFARRNASVRSSMSSTVKDTKVPSGS